MTEQSAAGGAPQEEWLGRCILRRFHEVVEERAAVLLVDGHVPAVLVEVDVWLPRQRRDLVGRLQSALVRAQVTCLCLPVHLWMH